MRSMTRKMRTGVRKIMTEEKYPVTIEFSKNQLCRSAEIFLHKTYGFPTGEPAQMDLWYGRYGLLVDFIQKLFKESGKGPFSP